MHRLRHEAKSVRVRTSLENFICKFNIDPSLSHFTYFEKSLINTNNLLEAEDKSEIKDYSDNTEDVFHEEIDDSYADEPKLVKKENEKTLLQIPVELLPCPQDVKTVTDRTYTYPSQNEAIDYRNLIQASMSHTIEINVRLSAFVMLLCIYLV